MHVISLDIGGANLKAADNDGNAVSRPFALWREPRRLPEELRALLTEWNTDHSPLTTHHSPNSLAVTMTAELCDCFATKAEGIDFILKAVEAVADGAEILVWQTGGEFVPPDVAREIPLLVAAANWHALATFCGRMVPSGAALLIDVGSTTTDIIPLLDGRPVATGMTDRQRLESGELVYTGARRTPVCAVSRVVEISGDSTSFPALDGVLSRSERRQSCSLAAELFATMLDVYLILGDVPEDPGNCDTANGKPATKFAAGDRLARMVCCDRTELTEQDISSLADQLAEMQTSAIVDAADRVLRSLPVKCGTVITSGSGEFLAARVADRVLELSAAERISLPRALGPQIATAACAYAVARLAGE